MNKILRNKGILQLRKEGKTYREIGAVYNLSCERVRCIINRESAYNKMLKNETDIFLKTLLETNCKNLTGRTINVLKKYGYVGDYHALAVAGPKVLLKHKNMGRKSVELIAEVLERLGDIPSKKDWMRRFLLPVEEDINLDVWYSTNIERVIENFLSIHQKIVMELKHLSEKITSLERFRQRLELLVERLEKSE